MKSPSQYLRKTLFALLNGNVSYNSADVPTYENDQDHDDALQIVIGEYSDADKSNKENFVANGSQVIEVISIQADGTKKTVDEVGMLATSLIQPTRRSEVLSGTDYQVFVIGKPSQNHLIETNEAGQKVVRLILRYQLTIIER